MRLASQVRSVAVYALGGGSEEISMNYGLALLVSGVSIETKKGSLE